MKLTAEQVRDAIEGNSFAETCTIREFNDSSWQAIAYELNVELGALEPHSNQLEHTRWHELFGTSERAAETAWRLLMCRITTRCDECPMRDGCNISTDIDCDDGEAALLEWLRGESDGE